MNVAAATAQTLGAGELHTTTSVKFSTGGVPDLVATEAAAHEKRTKTRY